MDYLAILSGFGVGAIVGITGVGGGSLMTPLRLSVFKLSPAVAIGTDLWFAAITKIAGSASHHNAGHVDWKITRLLLAGSIPAALATIALMHFTGVTKGWASALTLSLGIALLLTAVTVASGLVLGVLVSLSSIGAGAIGATLILLLYPKLGHVDWALLAALLVGSIPCIWLGSQLTRKMPDRLVRALLCISLVTAGPKVLT